MSVPVPGHPQPVTPSTVVARLRAAGCVFAEDEARLLVSAARTPADLAAMVERRVAGLPLEHILGWVEFCDLRIAVDPDVFVPRRRTGFLVQVAAALARRTARPRPVVVDLCCGSGAVGVAVAAAVGDVELHAADIDPAAVRCARRNVADLGQVHAGDLFQPLPATLRGRVDILVANAPYVPTDEVALMPPEARLHEPLTALDGGPDGLAVLRRVIAAAPAWLAPGAHLLFEASTHQVPYAVDTISAHGLTPHVTTDEDRHATVITATH